MVMAFMDKIHEILNELLHGAESADEFVRISDDEEIVLHANSVTTNIIWICWDLNLLVAIGHNH